MRLPRFNIEPFYRFMAKVFAHFFYDLEFIGFDHIPRKGPALLIANHVSYIDGVLIQVGCKRPIRFLIDKFIYEMPIVNYFMGHNRAIPILPKKENVIHALDAVSDGLENGDIIGVFPEGRITFTGHLGRFKPGVEWIIERDPVPIYPIAIIGVWDSMYSRKYIRSKFRWFPKGFRGKVRVVCGKALHPEHVGVNKLQRSILELMKHHGKDI